MASILVTLPYYQVYAVSASDWRAGNIISDSLFTDASAMSATQIQSWLDAKLSNCDYWGVQPSEFGGGTRADYGAAHNNPAPFTCLNNYYEVPKTSPGNTIPASNYGKSTIPTGAKSAAQLIYDAAQTYNISPKVLLVKLGTESAGPLTSDTWPFKSQYLYAMGAHCPDSGVGGSANCDVNYAGFSLQIREAAKLLRYYLDNMTQSWWPYKQPYQTNYILWNVQETGCGGSNVYIQSKATAALYTYTPYQPNSAALNNMYGTGDGCSAYGNRNFWRVYSDWFGSTQSKTTPFMTTSSSNDIYIMGADNTYYRVRNPAQLYSYGYRVIFTSVKTVSSTSLSGMVFAGDLPNVVRFTGSNKIYAVANKGKLYHFPDSASYTATYGLSFGDEAILDLEWLAYFTPSTTMAAVMRLTDDNKIYSIDAGKKHHIATYGAFTQLGSPQYSSRPSVTLDSNFAASLSVGQPIILPGTTILNTSTNERLVWNSDNTMYKLDARLVDPLFTSAEYSADAATLSLLPSAAVAIGDYAKDATETIFALSATTKTPLTQNQATELGINESTLPIISDTTLDRWPTTEVSDTFLRFDSAKTVYLQQSTPTEHTIRHVTTPGDLALFDGSFDKVSSIPSQLQQLYTDRGPIYPEGTLISASSDSRVFVTDADKLRHVSSLDLFKQYGFQFSNVRTVASLASLTNYTEDSALQRIVNTDSTIMIVDQGKRLVISPQNLNQWLAIDPLSVQTVTQSVLSKTSQGATMRQYVRGANANAVYKLEGGKKYHYVTAARLLQDTSWSGVQVMSEGFMATIPYGGTVSP